MSERIRHARQSETVYHGVLYVKFLTGVARRRWTMCGSPDLAFVTAGRERIITDRGLIDAPDLVVEVVSPGATNSERDRQLKRQLYSVRGVREYWIVDPQLRTIEIYRQRENALALAATLHESDTLTSALLPGFSCSISDIFA
jgi:Uma2 family endonuclease